MNNLSALADLLKRFTCLFVAFCFFIHIASPAMAQVSKPRFKLNEKQKEALDKSLNQRTFEAVSTRESTSLPRIEQEKRLQQQVYKIDQGRLSDKDKARLIQIDGLLNPNSTFSSKTAKDAFATFKTELTKDTAAQKKAQLAQVNERAAQAKADLKAQANQMIDSGKYDTAQVEEWRKGNEALINKWQQDSVAQLNAWSKKRNAQAEKIFNQAQADSLARLEKQIFQAVKDLFVLKDKAPFAKRKLMTLSLRVLPLRTRDGKSFFTPQQKQTLHSLYTNALKSAKCDKDCSFPLTAVVGLGMVGSSVQDAQLVENFMEKQRAGAYSVPVLLAGASALLAMKQYGVLRGFIHSATEKERDISHLDLFSVTTAVDVLKNINGQYLGEVSKYAVYPLTKDVSNTAAFGNAWEDLALLLATEGSKESLAILKEFGVDRCVVYVSKTVTLKNEYKMACTGIVPFLAGALHSGKSGAENYTPQGNYLQPGAYLDSFGRSVQITPQQASQNRKGWESRRALFNQYLAITGLSASAAVARHLFKQSMGDLSAESELLLDQKLYKVYASSAKKRAPKPGYAISAYSRGSAAYNAKRVRQDRTNWWLKAAQYADIAILVWCLVDISKLALKGANLGRAMYKAMNMARSGATVTQRAMMLRRFNVVKPLRTMRNIPVRLRKGLEPVVLAQLPQFATVPTTAELLKVPGGFVPAASKLVASNLKFSAEVGVLSVGKPAAVHPTVLNEGEVASLNASLAAATQRANTAFANRGTLAKLTTVSADGAYRQMLAKEISQLGALPGYKPGETASLAAEVKNLKTVKVPENIASFERRPLLSNGQPDGVALNSLLSATLGGAPTAQQTAYVTNLLTQTIQKTNAQYAAKSWFKRKFSRGSYKKAFMSNLAQTMDADKLFLIEETYGKIGQALMHALNGDASVKAPISLAGIVAEKAAPAKKQKVASLGASVLVEDGAAPAELPLNVYVASGFGGAKKAGYQRAIFTQGKSGVKFGFGTDLSSVTTPGNFKLTLADSQISAFAAAAERANLTSPFELKLTSTGKPGFFNSLKSPFVNRWNLFRAQKAETGKWSFKNILTRSKEDMYAHEIPVFRRTEAGGLVSVPLTLKADTYLGLKDAQMVLGPSGSVNFYRGGQLLTGLSPFSYGVRKTQLKPFMDIVRQAPAGMRFDLTVKGTPSKLVPLYIATGLSLSSASSSLIAPLENIYGDRITETDKTMISLALPYIPSLLTPVFSPLVMKIGALKTVKIALGTAFGGLLFAGVSGFGGKVNEDNLPPIWPLFVSGAAIGLSSALNRSGLNLLIDRIGGGGSLLTSMAFKNMGSMAMLLPPILANTFAPGATDFSLAFPVLGTISALSFGSLYFSRIDPNIGKVAGFMKFKPVALRGGFYPALTNAWQNTRTLMRDGWGETWGSLRILASKELLPLTAAAFTFTGFEAATFNKAANQLIRPSVKGFDWINNNIHEDNRNNWVALVTSGTVVAFPLLVRLRAKSLLGALKDPLRPGLEYQRMLKLSYGMNILGGATMMTFGFDGFTSPGFLGIALVGMGTANVTQSLQKLANMNVVRGGYVAARTKGLAAAEAAVVRDKAATTAMTVFSLSQTGLAAVPLMVSHYTDGHIKAGIEARADVPRTSLWMPLTSIGLSMGLAAPSIGLFPKQIPTGAFGLTKGVFGSYGQAFGQTYNWFTPQQGTPYGTPSGFMPMPTQTASPAPEEKK